MYRNRTNRKGFTLVELLVVIIILGILAALIIPRLFGHKDEAMRAKATSDIAEISSALSRFRIDTDRFPTDEEGLQALVTRPSDVKTWNGPYIEKLPTDPWQNDYVYKDLGNDSYEVMSYGADGAEGGDGNNADIVNQSGQADQQQPGQ